MRREIEELKKELLYFLRQKRPATITQIFSTVCSEHHQALQELIENDEVSWDPRTDLIDLL